MRELLSPPQVRALLAAHGLRPSKSLGQSYLADPNTARKVVRLAGVESGEQVLEVGPGLGSLTLALRAAGAAVVAVEVDPRLVPALAEVLADDPDVRVVVADALLADLGALAPEACRLVANLPYNIAATLVLRVLTTFPALTELTVMVQREVGERLAAAAGTPANGGISVKVAALANARVLTSISRRVFVPEPHVDSVVVGISRREDAAAADYAALDRTVSAAFGQRRKTLRNSLQSLGRTADEVETACRAAGIEPGARAERLDLAQFTRLTTALELD